MRLTEILQSTNGTVSQSKYERLRKRGLKTVMCSPDGWQLEKESGTTEAEARKWIKENRLISSYEKKHGLDDTCSMAVIKVINDKSQINSPNPEWPDELKPYQGKAANILEAYFCNKFNLPCE